MTENKLTLSQLEQYLSKAAWILKEPVDATDFKVYIFPLLFFKRISDVYDDEYNQAMAESGGDEDYRRDYARGTFSWLTAFHREVQKSLRKALLKYQLHKDQALFDRAYAYIKEYY